jgi:anaerobic ribonucleoside-triphosphate reductase activating protein
LKARCHINIWIYTGFLYGQLVQCSFTEIFKYVDAIVDGRYIERLKDEKLPYRGSSNQKIFYFENGKITNVE